MSAGGNFPEHFLQTGFMWVHPLSLFPVHTSSGPNLSEHFLLDHFPTELSEPEVKTLAEIRGPASRENWRKEPLSYQKGGDSSLHQEQVMREPVDLLKAESHMRAMPSSLTRACDQDLGRAGGRVVNMSARIS